MWKEFRRSTIVPAELGEATVCRGHPPDDTHSDGERVRGPDRLLLHPVAVGVGVQVEEGRSELHDGVFGEA